MKEPLTNMKTFIDTPHSDLALEKSDARHTERELNGFTVSSSDFGLSHASTLILEKNDLFSESIRLSLQSTVSSLIREAFDTEKLDSSAPVMVICLGNSSLTPDSIGPLCSKKIVATRQIKTASPDLFKALGSREVCVIAPGVSAETGLESAESTKALTELINPSAVIAVDSLMSRSPSRLFSAIQVSNGGIAPGAGVGNRRAELSKKTLGIPVISVGVPTVVSTTALLNQALESIDNEVTNAPIIRLNKNQKDFFVTLNDCDTYVKIFSDIISAAINLTLVGINEI